MVRMLKIRKMLLSYIEKFRNKEMFQFDFSIEDWRHTHKIQHSMKEERRKKNLIDQKRVEL